MDVSTTHFVDFYESLTKKNDSSCDGVVERELHEALKHFPSLPVRQV